MLVGAGAGVSAQDAEGSTPLHLAVLARHMPLHQAVFWGEQHMEVIRVLLDAGADVEAKDSIGETPLHFASKRWEREEVVVCLLDAGADVASKDSQGRTPACTLNPKPSTLDPFTPSPLHPTPYTLHPTPSTLNPQPQTSCIARQSTDTRRWGGC